MTVSQIDSKILVRTKPLHQFVHQIFAWCDYILLPNNGHPQRIGHSKLRWKRKDEKQFFLRSDQSEKGINGLRGVDKGMNQIDIQSSFDLGIVYRTPITAVFDVL